MGAGHHQRRPRPLVGDIAHQHGVQALADLEMIDQVAAHLAGRLQHHLDGDPAERRIALRRRRSQGQLQVARLVQFGPLALQLPPRAVAKLLLLQRGQHPSAQDGRVEGLEDEILGALLEAAGDRFDLAQG